MVLCDWCGQVHPVEDLCRRGMSRRSFAHLVGLGLLGLGLGPHVFDPKAPMLGPRIDAFGPNGVLSSMRLQEGVLSYPMLRNVSRDHVSVTRAAVRGTRDVDFETPMDIVLLPENTLTFAVGKFAHYPEPTFFFAGCALSMPGGLFNTQDEIRRRLLNGECTGVPPVLAFLDV